MALRWLRMEDGAERRRSVMSGGKLQVDPPYFEHGGCSAVAGFGRCLLGASSVCASSCWRPPPSQKTGRSAVCRHRHRGCPTHLGTRQLKG